MFKLFRETYASLQDSFYGRIIVEKPIKSIIWYWTCYFLLIVFVSLIISIFFLTNKLPQLPKFIDTNFPDGRLEMQDGILTSTITQPLIVGDSEFSFVFDITATASALSPYQSGILISGRELIIKSEDGSENRQSYQDLPYLRSFSTSKTELSAYITSNYLKLWLSLSLGLLLLTLVFGSLVWSQKFISYLIWSAVFLLISRYLLKKTLSYVNTLKLVIYASVLPLLLSVIISVSPNPILDILNLAVLAYFSFNWILNLDRTSSTPSLSPPLSSSTAKKISSSRRRRKTSA